MSCDQKKKTMMIGNNIWDDEGRSWLLHILPQSVYHGPAGIRGSPMALRRLGEALIEASEKGQCEVVEVQMMASDGEGYTVEIRQMSDQQMEDGPLPYAQFGLPWDFTDRDRRGSRPVE